MDAKTSTWDFDMDLLHPNLDAQTLYYCTSAIALVVASSLVAWFNQKKYLAIPFHGLDENDEDAPRKRWMWDSINLLQEGYRKVIY
jgi:hypothetical protein